MPIIIYPGHLSLDVASQFVVIRRDSGSTDFDWPFDVILPVVLTKLQRGLLIKLVRNIQCNCIKNVKAFGDDGWDLRCMMEVKVGDSYVYHLTLINNNHAQQHVR